MKKLFILILIAVIIIFFLFRKDAGDVLAMSFNAFQESPFVDRSSALSIDFTPVKKLQNLKIKITFDSAFSDLDKMTNDDISVSSIDLDSENCTNFSNNSFWCNIKLRNPSDSQITMRIGGDHKPVNPVAPGNYSISIDLYEDDQNGTQLLANGNSYLFYEMGSK